MFQRQTYTPEHARAGITKESIDTANERIDQAAQAGYQRDVAEAQRLRADAARLREIPHLSGQAQTELNRALMWPLDPPHVVEAVRQLQAAIQWANDDARCVGMTPAAPPQHRVPQQAQPKAPPTLESLARTVELQQAQIAELIKRLS